MARAEGASFSTAETVPGERPTCTATAFSVTVAGWSPRDVRFWPIRLEAGTCAASRVAYGHGRCQLFHFQHRQHVWKKTQLKRWLWPIWDHARSVQVIAIPPGGVQHDTTIQP